MQCNGKINSVSLQINMRFLLLLFFYCKHSLCKLLVCIIGYYKFASKVTAKELLTILMPVHKPEGCLPVIRSAEKCNKLNDDVEKPFGDFVHSNNDRKVDENLKKVFSKLNNIYIYTLII